MIRIAQVDEGQSEDKSTGILRVQPHVNYGSKDRERGMKHGWFWSLGRALHGVWIQEILYQCCLRTIRRMLSYSLFYQTLVEREDPFDTTKSKDVCLTTLHRSLRYNRNDEKQEIKRYLPMILSHRTRVYVLLDTVIAEDCLG